MAGQVAAVELQVLIKVLQDQSASFKSMMTDAKGLFDTLKSGQAGTNTNNLTGQFERLAAAIGQGKTIASQFAPTAGKGLEEVTKKSNTLEESLNKLLKVVKLAAGGFLAFQSVRFIKDLADTAARSEVLSTVLHVVGNNAGILTEQLDSLDRQVQKLGITAQASRQALTQMIQAGLDPALAAGPRGLARAAQDLAVIGGINSSEAFSRLISAIQRMDTLSLRSLGITVSNERAQQKFADSINKSVGQLTQQQKVQATANAVLEEAIKLTGTYERAQGDVGKMLTSLPRYTEELATAVGSQLLPAYRAIIEEWTTFLKQMLAIADGNTDLKDALSGLVSVIHAVGGALRTVAIFFAEHADLIIKIVQGYLLWKAVAGTMTFLVTLPKLLADVISGFVAWRKELLSLIAALRTFFGLQQAKTFSDMITGMTAAATAAKTLAPAIEGVGVAATTTQTALTALASSWVAAAALFAIPVVIGGFLISKALKQSAEDREKDPIKLAIEADEGTTALLGDPQARIRDAFDQWVKDNPEKVRKLGGLTKEDEVQFLGDSGRVAPLSTTAPVSKAFLDEVEQAKKDEESDRKAAKLSEREAAVEKAKVELQDLKLKAAQQGGKGLDDDIDRKNRELERLQRQADRAKEATETEDKRSDSLKLRDQEVEAIDKVAQAEQRLNEVKATNYRDDADRVKALIKAQKDLDEASKEKKNITALREAANVRENVSTEEEKKRVEAAGRETIRLRVENEQLEARRKLLGDENVIKEGAVSDRAAEATSNFLQLVQRMRDLNAVGGDTTDTMISLERGLLKMQGIQKTPADLKIYTAALDEFARAAKEAGKFTNETKLQIDIAKQTAQIQVTQATEAQTATVRAFQKNRTDALAAQLKDRLAFEQQTLQAAHQKQEQIDKEDLDKALISQDEYFDARIVRIREASAQEARLAEADVKAAQERLRRATSEEKPQAQRALKDAQEKVTEVEIKAQSQVDAENAKRREANLSIGRQAQQQSLETAAFYGGLTERIAVINNQYDEQIRALGNLATATQEVKNRADALNAAREKDIYSATLDDQNKKLQQQQQLQEARLSLAETRVSGARDRGELTTNQARNEGNALIRERLELNRQQIEIQTVILRGALDERNARIAANQPYQVFQDQATASFEKLTTLHSEAVRLATSIETYGEELQKTFGEGLQNILTEATFGAGKFQDAIKNFQEGLRRQIIGAYTKEISERITASLGPKIDETGKRTGGIFDAPFRFLGLGRAPSSKKDGSSKTQALWVEVVNPPVTASVTTSVAGEAGAVLPSRQLTPFSSGIVSTSSSDAVRRRIEEQVVGLSGRYSTLVGALSQGINRISSLFRSSGTIPTPAAGYGVLLAEGGMVSGPGTGTSDSIPAMVSTGEHIMPAEKTALWGGLLEGIRLGRYDGLVNGGFAQGGFVGNVQSIAIAPLIPRRYASGGVVVSDGGASSVTPAGGGGGNMQIMLHPEAMNMTMREWLELEVARQQTRR